MTRFEQPSGNTLIKWDPGDKIDWTTPNSTYRDHEFCGNCGLDAPGCGCPRDCDTCRAQSAYCGHLYADDDGWEEDEVT